MKQIADESGTVGPEAFRSCLVRACPLQRSQSPSSSSPNSPQRRRQEAANISGNLLPSQILHPISIAIHQRPLCRPTQRGGRG